jgi:hypothetical protein
MVSAARAASILPSGVSARAGLCAEAGDAHIYNEGNVHSPKRVATTGLIRIEDKNPEKMKRFAYKAVE